MKKNLLSLWLVLFVTGLSFAQPLTGTKSVPGDYSTIAAAIADLNVKGVGSGGVMFNISANYTETFTTPASGTITTLTGSSTNPIIFQKSGTGNNPTVTSATGTGALDAIFTIAGCDYVTFDGIDILDNSANSTTTTMMEWGFAILKASTTDGSQNITIKNCSIKLNPANTASVGIYSNNHLTTSTTQLTVSSVTGTNSNLKIYSNTINKCYTGISISGYNHTSAPYTYFDQNNEIGKDGGNLITNFGGSTVAMNGIYTIYQNNLTVANNNVSGTVTGTTGQCAGIQLGSSPNGTLSMYGNTVSVQYGGTGAFYGIYDNMTVTGTTSNSINIYNNNVTGCTYNSATSGACNLFYITHGGPTSSIHDNIVSNNTMGSSTATATGTFNCFYIQANPTTNGTADVYNNQVTNNTRTQSVLGAGSNYLYWLNSTGNVSNVYNNVALNNTTSSTGIVYGFYYLTGSAIKNFYNNTVSGIYNANGIVYGISNGNGYTVNMYKNTVRDINSNAANSTVYGIHFSSLTGPGVVNINNNFISELRTPNATIASTSPCIAGMYVPASQVNNLGIYYNTIYLDAISTGVNFNTTGIYLNSVSASNDLRNNIVINKSTPNGTGIASALQYDAITSIGNYSNNSNNNNYYAGVPSNNHVIFYAGTVYDKTLPDFKLRFSPKENFSITENTSFVNTSTSPYNLHVNATVPAQVESAASIVTSPATISSDFDNEARYPNLGYPVNGSYPAVAPDMGADEFGGIPNDVTPPTVIYTPFAFTAYAGNKNLVATISDANGVPTSGIGLPRLAWKRFSNGTWHYVTGTSLGSNQYNFAFGEGTIIGDTVFYFILAQDQFSNPAVGCTPFEGASGFSANPPSCSTPPTNPAFYIISGPLCGTFTVGAGQNYPTLTAAINDYNSKEITCPVVFELTDASYSAETFPLVMNLNPGSNSTNTLTIRPSLGNTPTISGSGDCVFKFNGAKYIIIDGSKSGATDKSLTIINDNSAAYAAVFKFSNSGNVGASNITIKNCSTQTSIAGAYATYGVWFDGNTGAGGYSNIIFDNNNITTCRFGMYIIGTAVNPASNIQVINNTIGSDNETAAVSRHGIDLNYADNVLIQGNEVMGLASGTVPIPQIAGIFVSTGTTNVRILKNKVHDWVSNTTGISINAMGIVYGPSTPTTGEVSDNLVYNIKHPGQSTNPIQAGNPWGIAIGNNVGVLKIYHNTIWMTGNYLQSDVACSSTCLSLGNNNTQLDVRNNILKNSSQPVSGSPASKSFAVIAGTGTTFGTMDKNDYFIDGVGPTFGYYNTAVQQTLADWQTTTGKDAQSVYIDPMFAGVRDLHQTNPAIEKLGVYISSLPSDIDGTTFTDPSDFGAYQVSGGASVTTNAVSFSGEDVILNGSITPNGNNVISGFEYGTTTAYGNFIAATPGTVNGTTTTGISATLSGLPTNVIYNCRAVGTSGSSVAYGANVEFIKLPPLVTFTVDMSTANGFVPGTDLVYIAGNFPGASWNEPGSNPALQLNRVGTSLIYSIALPLPAGTYEYKYFKNAGWAGGEYAGGTNRSITVTGVLTQNDVWGGVINWANLQWPGTGSISVGGAYDVYAQAYIPNGITAATGATYGLQAWIGYSTDNTDPNTWTNWIPAPFFGQSYDNDEFKADLGSALTSAGTYYYASRFQFGSSPYVYGGFNGGSWNGTTNISGILTVTEGSKTLNVKAFLSALMTQRDGIFPPTGTMYEAIDGNSGLPQFGAGIADVITVQLFDATPTLVTQFTGVQLHTNGTATINLPGNYSGNYYIRILPRTHIAVWSATMLSFAGSNISYDFTDNWSKAYQFEGNDLLPEKMISTGIYALYLGDQDHNTYIDIDDMSTLLPDVSLGTVGYVESDVDGYGWVDIDDMALLTPIVTMGPYEQAPSSGK